MHSPFIYAVLALLTLAACSTTESRIRQEEAEITRKEKVALSQAKTEAERQDIVDDHDTARRMLRSGRAD
jgi:hypothetical protein